MSSPGPSLTTTCAHCKGFAYQACNGCGGTPGSVEKAYYCNAECQKADWTNHKQLCKSLQVRKVLYRAGSILQQVFYSYREIFFDMAISKLTKTDRKWYIHEGKYGGKCSEFHVMEPFPSALFSEIEDKQAVLTHLACSDAVACMHELVKDLLSDVASQFEEVLVTPDNNKRVLVTIDILGGEDKHVYDHELVKVTLKHGGGCFALDLTGAQYGYHEPVTPWIEYLGERVKDSKVKEIKRFGAGIERYTKLRTDPGLHATVVKLNLLACKVLKDVTTDWQKLHMLSLSRMLKLSPAEFEKMRGLLIDTIVGTLQDFKEHLGRQAQKATRK